MTMEPSQESARKYIQRAQEFLKDSILLLEQGSLLSAIDRAYYVMHSCALALLAHQGVRLPRSHRGLLNLFGSEIVQKGILDREFSKMLSTASDDRMSSTYSIETDITFGDVQSDVDNAGLFLEKVRSILMM